MVGSKKLRILVLGLLIGVVGSVAPHSGAAVSTKRVIVHCDPQDFDGIRQLLGGALVDAHHGHYLIEVPATTDLSKVAGFKGKSTVIVGNNNPVTMAPPYWGRPYTTTK